jgi:hypothetical protein
MHFELVHVGDPRSLGGSSAALRGDLAAAAAWGVDVAVLPMIGPSAGPPLRRFEPRTARVIDRPGVTWIDGSEPATCDLLLAHHPFLFEHMPSRPLRVRPKRLVCVVHHPPFDAFGQPEYDLARVEAVLGSVFGVPPVFAPVGPKVRRQFHALGRAAPPVAAHDLANVIDLAEWPYRERPHPRRTMVIGRHARNDPRKWPDTRSDFLEAYPPSEHVRYRNLGGVPERVQPWITPDWTDVPFGTDGVPAFLDGLDAWVYVHSRGWVEAFGLAIAEALATGLRPIGGPD